MKVYPNWKVGFKETKEAAPVEMVTASVPGGAQLDWANAHQWEDLNYGENARRFTGLEEKFWLYQTTIELPAEAAEKRIFFVSKGIDYQFEILLNGECLFAQEGMFTPVELELTGKVTNGDRLEVLIYPAPRRKGAKYRDHEEADQSCKPPVSYGWDWHPYLIPLGIWDETFLELREKTFFAKEELRYALSEDYTRADVTVCTEIDGGEGEVCCTLWDPDGNELLSTKEASFAVENPRLWWCIGQGEPALYRYHLQLWQDGSVIDEKEGRIGFCTVSLEMNEGAWREEGPPPCSRPNAAITVCLNGRKIFAKGTNWVPPEIFPGTITREHYRELLQLAKDANMNMVRCWGGGIVNKDVFFELCDEMGMLVWQEFPLAGNNYRGTPHYLSVLAQESDSIVRRLRRHPSLTIWCGGNELLNSWSRMTDQSLALRLLNAKCLELDPHRPFLSTSPQMGMGHGTYLFYEKHRSQDTFQLYPSLRCTAYSEFGVPSSPDADYLRSFIPPDEQFPPKPEGSWLYHHAFSAWRDENPWLCLDVLERYFGKPTSLEDIAYQSQWLQSEGYRSIFEEARRQKPHCSMALNWCYNEPWKTAANNSILSYPAVPKKSYYAVKEALRPLCLSARIPRFDWKPGEEFKAEIWLLNDMPKAVEPMLTQVYLCVDGRKEWIGEVAFAGASENTNQKGREISCILPIGCDTGYFELILEGPDGMGVDASYRLQLKERSEG